MNRVQFGEGACENTRRYMDAYISNELLVETNHELLRHLEGCATCTQELDMRTRLRSRLKSAVQSQLMPPELPTLVRERIRRRQSAAWYAGFSMTVPAIGWVMAATAALVITAGTWINYTRPLSLPDIGDRTAQTNYIQKVSASVASIFKSGLSDHIHCSVFRKYPTNAPSVEEMEADLGPEYRGLLALVRPLIPAGYHLAMAHQCTYSGRHFVHLTMRNGAQVISLVVAKKQNGETLAGLSPSTHAGGVPVYHASTDSYQVAAFESERYLAFVVSGLSSGRNAQLAAALAPGVRRLLS